MTESTGFTNDVEICIVACKRSGHHAILNWIAEQFAAEPYVLNNCRVGESPFTETRRRLERRGSVDEAEACRAEESGALTEKRLLIYNFEDCDLRAVFSPEERSRRERALGPSRTRLNVVVLRDHYNLFASRLHRVRLGSDVPRERLDKALAARDLYVQYARECLGETSIVDEPCIPVLYNHWFTDAAYRRDLSARLGGTFRDDSMRRVAAHGEGSSFDGVAFGGRADEMAVLDRWRGLASNHFYRAIVGDAAMRRCTARLFPELDGPPPSLTRQTIGRVSGLFLRALDGPARFLRRRGVLR